jgi:hypothetical protein
VVLTGDTDELVAYIPARRMRVFVPPGLMGLASPAGPTGAGSVPAPLPVVHAVQKLNPTTDNLVDFRVPHMMGEWLYLSVFHPALPGRR